MPRRSKKTPAKKTPKVDQDLQAQIAGFAEAGNITIAQARELWDSALDGPGVTQTEFATLNAALENYKFTAGGTA
jgi:hypothetical protein